MRWRDGRRSANVEDRRRLGGAGVRVGGGALLVVVVVMLLGGDPGMVLDLVGGSGAAPAATPSVAEDELADFVSVVLADTEDTWAALFAEQGARYRPARLVLFSGAVQSACGTSSAAVGPFYCPADQTVYIDLSFYRELRERFGAPGDFAQAYVIAHEVGHHVQNLQGTAERVHALRSRANAAESNALSVRLELQADCYAGVWARRADEARGILETGDVEEGMNAAAAIGDDRLQRGAGVPIREETWTHGSSTQRVEWFRRGFQSGGAGACDTFSTERG